MFDWDSFEVMEMVLIVVVPFFAIFGNDFAERHEINILS